MRSFARPARTAGFLKFSLLASTALLATPSAAQQVAAAAAATAETEVSEDQSAEPAPELARPSDDIVVTGRRPIAESEAAALRVQKNSDSLVSVLSSDAVGRLPDQNVPQAVSRLPGVSVQRDQGQARYTNLRGAPLNWTT